MFSVNRELKRNFIYNSFYQILIIFLPLITTPYVSRAIGAEGVGIYSYYYSIANYFVLFILLGLNNYGNRTIAATLTKGKCSTTFINIYFFQFCSGVFIFLCYSIYTIFFTDNIIVSAIFGLHVISGILDINWFFAGKQKFNISVSRNIIIKLIGAIAILGFIKHEQDVNAYCLIIAMSSLCSQLLLWLFVFKEIDFHRPKLFEVKKHIKPNITLFITVLAVSIYKIMDKIMLGIMTSYTEVGYYESSEKIINIPIAFVVALGTVMLPYTTKLISKGLNQNKRMIHISLLLSMILTVGLSFGIMSVADVFVPVFYGKGYEKCINLFYILMPSCIFLAFANVIRTQYLLPNKMDREYIKSAFIGAGINFLVNVILIPFFASIGAAIGTLVSEAFVCLYQCFVCKNGFDYNQILKKITPIMFSGIIMFVSLNFLHVCSSSPFVVLTIKIIAGGCIYFLCLLLIWKMWGRWYISFLNE